jgi:hypothetical protein
MQAWLMILASLFFAEMTLNDMRGICWRGHDLAPDQLQRHCRNRIM